MSQVCGGAGAGHSRNHRPGARSIGLAWPRDRPAMKLQDKNALMTGRTADHYAGTTTVVNGGLLWKYARP